MVKTNYKTRRASRTRSKLKKSLNLRLSVFRSNKHIYGQLIDDINSATILSTSSHDKSFKNIKTGNKESAYKVGELLGDMIKKKGIEKKILFDRGNYLFHGRVKEFASGVRSKGIKF